MTQKQLFSALLPVLVALSLAAFANANANERQYYETRICEDCNYNYALKTAKEIKPEIKCTSGTTQAQAIAKHQCFAKPIKILVVDANSRNIWHFENTYTNQANHCTT